jgi:xylulokinase
MSYLVGIDLGSTNLKAIVYDTSGNAVARASRPTQRFNPYPDHPQWAIWKPEQIWGGVAESLREAVAQLDDPKRIRGVAVTGMGMDGVPLDRTGRWLYPFISWHCPRTEPQYQWWLEHIGPEKQFAVGGNQLWVFNTALRLLWMAQHEPQILTQTHKWVLIEDFVNFMLCGVLATDYSMASTTLLFDQRQRGWSAELLGFSGIDRALLCDPQPSGTVLGVVHAAAAAVTGLPAGTPVVLGGHDYLCGALPIGAFRPGVVCDVTGTWEMVVAAIPEPVLTPAVREMGILVDSHVARGMWAVMGATVAAEQLEWFRREYGALEKQRAEQTGGVDWDYLMEAAAVSPPGAHGCLFLPHMSGSHCPVVDHRSLGAFVGLKNICTKGDMLRAIIEGLDYQFLQVVQGLDRGLNVRPDNIVAIGGAINNAFWLQNKADVVGKPIQVPNLEEAVVLGAAILAGIGVGVYRDEQDAYRQVHRPGRCYEPDAALHARYREWFATFERLYPSLKEIQRVLHGVI